MTIARAVAFAALMAWGSSALYGQQARAPMEQLIGAWQGTVGVAHPTVVRFGFSADSGRVRGTFDAVQSGVLDWPVRVFSDSTGNIRFVLPNGWTMQAQLKGQTLSGVLNGNGLSAPFTLRRARRVSIPYAEESVEFRNEDVVLAGTLLSPRGKGAWPAAVFAHGSGEVDRTADRFLGDYLARHGVAVLLYDKRGVGKSTGEWRRASLDALAADAVAGVRLLRAHVHIDSTRIGVIGRSQGGQLAVISASRYPDVAFAIDIAGSLIAPWQQMNYETAANMTRDKMTTADSIAAQSLMNQKWQVARTGNNWDSLAQRVRDAREAKAAWLKYVQLPDRLSDITGSWTGQMGFDYAPILTNLTKPVLALFGEFDTSTPTTETVAALRAGTTAAHNSHVTIRVYPSADHSLLVWPEHPAELIFPSYPSGYPAIIPQWIQHHR